MKLFVLLVAFGACTSPEYEITQMAVNGLSEANHGLTLAANESLVTELTHAGFKLTTVASVASIMRYLLLNKLGYDESAVSLVAVEHAHWTDDFVAANSEWLLVSLKKVPTPITNVTPSVGGCTLVSTVGRAERFVLLYHCRAAGDAQKGSTGNALAKTSAPARPSESPDDAKVATLSNPVAPASSGDAKGDAQKVSTGDSHAAVADSSVTGATGLANPGNMCYLNAIMQLLFHSGPFRQTLVPVDKTGLGVRMITAMRALFTRMAAGGDAANATPVRQLLEEVNPRLFRAKRQADAHEALRVLLGYIGDVGEVRQLFGLRIEKSRPCKYCPHVSAYGESLQEIALDVPLAKGKIPLELLLQSVVQTEAIEGVRCDSCYRRADAEITKRMANPLPPLLLIVLKRFTHNGIEAVKTNTNIVFNESMDFGKNFNIDSQVYKLTGIVHHSGSIDGGHYYADVLRETWYRADDSSVKLRSTPQTAGPTPYILLFERL